MINFPSTNVAAYESDEKKEKFNVEEFDKKSSRVY